MIGMHQQSKIYIAGHTGLVGSALLRKLICEGFNNIVTRTFEQLDLRNQQAVKTFFEYERPEYVFLAAAKVGGIWANSHYPASFAYDNMAIALNVIDAAYHTGVTKLLFLGSSCIYPRLSPQPMKEEYLLSGFLEPTNAPYAIAKIAGISLCQSYNRQYGTHFISCMPTNLYGPHDNFDLATAHVMPALIRKMIEAKLRGAELVEVWGTGNVLREFLYVDDLADALLFLMREYDDSSIINIGTGVECSIKELAMLIAGVVGFTGRLSFDQNKPDGAPRKLLDIARITALGWRAQTSLVEGIRKTVNWLEKQNRFSFNMKEEYHEQQL